MQGIGHMAYAWDNIGHGTHARGHTYMAWGHRYSTGAPPTFTEGEAIGTGHTRVTPQTSHAGPAAALATLGVADAVLGTLGGAVAGWGREGAVGTWALTGDGARWALGAWWALTGAVGEAVGARAALRAAGASVAGAAAAQACGAAGLVQAALRVTAAGCGDLVSRGRQGGEGPASRLLTLALGVTVVAGAAAVTVGAIEARAAQAVSLLVTALRQRPREAAATHCRERV